VNAAVGIVAFVTGRADTFQSEFGTGYNISG
jgi:hypothetical protein